MELDENIASEIQKLEPSAIIELFELDCTDLGGDVFRFHNGTNKLSQDLVWQGNTYTRFPIQVTGFEISGQGQFPRPTVTVSNVLSAITSVLLQYNDLLNAKFTRKRTFLKYLDAVNFPGGVNPTADPDVYLADDIYYVDRKSHEDRDQVQFELASVADLQGVKIPGRVVVQATCPWLYRGADCGYVGIPLWDDRDQRIYTGASAEAIAAVAAYDAWIAAQDALVVAQAALVSAANAKTAAEQYTAEERYSLTTPAYYMYIAGLVVKKAVWNDVEVTLGDGYGQGAYVTDVSIPYWGATPHFKLIKYTRDEVALAAATAAYDAAVIARDDAVQDVSDAKDALDAAVAAMPPDDEMFRRDKCGKRVTSCKTRFGANNPLPFGGFPGVGK